jgi:hypothetical protein
VAVELARQVEQLAADLGGHQVGKVACAGRPEDAQAAEQPDEGALKDVIDVGHLPNTWELGQHVLRQPPCPAEDGLEQGLPRLRVGGAHAIEVMVEKGGVQGGFGRHGLTRARRTEPTDGAAWAGCAEGTRDCEPARLGRRRTMPDHTVPEVRCNDFPRRAPPRLPGPASSPAHRPLDARRAE